MSKTNMHVGYSFLRSVRDTDVHLKPQLHCWNVMFPGFWCITPIPTPSLHGALLCSISKFLLFIKISVILYYGPYLIFKILVFIHYIPNSFRFLHSFQLPSTFLFSQFYSSLVSLQKRAGPTGISTKHSIKSYNKTRCNPSYQGWTKAT